MGVSVEELAKLPFFAGLSQGALEEIARVTSRREYASGEVIVLEGDPCQAVHFIAKGLVRMHQVSPEGRDYVLAHLTAGECPDLGPALDGAGSLATLETLGKTTLYVIQCDRFLALMRRHADLALAAATYLASQLRRVSRLARDLALHTVRARLARFLLTHAEESPAQHRWTQEMIAAQIGTIRDVVGRSLRAFAEEGLIRRERGRLVIVDREALQREAGF